MADWNAIQAFMAAVVPWPASSDDAGWVNLHYSFPSRDDPKVLVKKGGWPKKTIESFISTVSWGLNNPVRVKDQWYCLSLQKETKTSKNGGKLVAHRMKANAITLRSIWIDIDVKANDPKHYPDIPAAWAAFTAFRTKVALPAPSAVINSGGGLHIYWINRDDLAPADWHAYADGLKQLLLANNILCDAGLTTDAARILRVPGTFNYKYDPPRPVVMLPIPLKLYKFEKDLAFLQQFAGPVVAAAPKAGFQLWADGVTRETFGNPRPEFAAFKDEPGLDAGIDKHADFKLDPRPIFTKCGFYRGALKNGGADYNQPLWMLSVLGTTFMENGDDIAHKISSGHSTYTAVDTQAMYDRKVAERASAGIGYPSCAAIAGAGCEACKACPLFQQGKSPLNIKPEPPKITATVNPAVQSSHAIAACLPAGFDFNSDGIICKVIETSDKEDGDTQVHLIPLFQAVLTDFWLQKHPGEVLNFTATMDKGFSEQVAVPLGEMGAQAFPSFLLKQRILWAIPGERFLKEFFVSTIGKLRALAAAYTSTPFGWYLDEVTGKKRGFVYGGKVMMDDGTERPCGFTDPHIQRMYRPKGTMADWLTAANTILDRQRPDLTSIILPAFAAPLMAFTDHNSLLWSACGSDSGAGKSSAAKIGLSVWGDPIQTKGTERQTTVNIGTIMGTIRHLPFYWDEISGTEKVLDQVSDTMMDADGGKDRGRNINQFTTQLVKTWQLMLSYTANPSLKEHVQKKSKETTARLMRFLEWEVKRIDSGPGYMTLADADVRIAMTRHNHGVMGEVYAKYLALNHTRIAAEVLSKARHVQALFNAQGDERFWTTGIALMILAAGYARDCGLNIDPASIEKFLYGVYQINIAQRDQFAQGGKIDSGESLMTQYLGDRAAAERGLWTNAVYIGRGRQKATTTPISILRGPLQPRNLQGAMSFRFAVDNHLLLITQADLNTWIEKAGRSKGAFYAYMVNTYQMTIGKVNGFSGTVHDTGRQEYVILQVGTNTPLWHFMTQWNNPEEQAKLAAGAEPQPVETGIEEEVARAA